MGAMGACTLGLLPPLGERGGHPRNSTKRRVRNDFYRVKKTNNRILKKNLGKVPIQPPKSVFYNSSPPLLANPAPVGGSRRMRFLGIT